MGEVRALEVRDVDLAGGRLLVRRVLSEDEVMPPKSGHERVVPLAPELLEAIRPFLREKLPTARVVLTATGSTPGRQHVLSVTKARLQRQSLPERSFHALRHCSARPSGAGRASRRFACSQARQLAHDATVRACGRW